MKTVKSPDLKAPRFRKTWISYLDNELLDKVKEKEPKASELTYNELRVILSTYNEAMWRHVIESRDGVELPQRLGHMFIATCPSPKRKNIDIPQSIKLGVAVEHKNWETDGHLGKVIYTNYDNKYLLKNGELWSFKTGRVFKRAVSASYPQNWTIYKKIEKNKLITAQIKSYIKKDIVINRSNDIPDDYNEFQLD
jgi:hypothetical protein